MKNNKKNKKKGFTLIEILVVVLIIGVLAAIAMPGYMRSVERSRAVNPMTNLGSIAKAQNAYRMGTEHYTDNVGNLDISLKDATNGEDANGSTFESEFFTYKVYGDDKAVAVATRKDVSEDKQYELSVDYNTNKIYCRPIENKTCIDLGLEEGQDYSQNSQGVPCEGGIADAIAGEGFEEYIVSMGGSCSFNNGVINYSVCTEFGCAVGQMENGIAEFCQGLYCSRFDIATNEELETRDCQNWNEQNEECEEWGEWYVPGNPPGSGSGSDLVDPNPIIDQK